MLVDATHAYTTYPRLSLCLLIISPYHFLLCLSPTGFLIVSTDDSHTIPRRSSLSEDKRQIIYVYTPAIGPMCSNLSAGLHTGGSAACKARRIPPAISRRAVKAGTSGPITDSPALYGSAPSVGFYACIRHDPRKGGAFVFYHVLHLSYHWKVFVLYLTMRGVVLEDPLCCPMF